MEVAVAERERAPLPGGQEAVSEEERVYIASQWQLMWWRFRKHKMALASTVVLMIVYIIALFWEFLAPYEPHRYDVKV